MLRQLRPAIMVFAALTFVCGVLYPLVVTGAAQTLFPRQANGSIIIEDGQEVGSSLIGQPFRDPKYFWSRPSATTPVPYNAASSSGSNLGPTNPALAIVISERVTALRNADPGNDAPIPVDLVTASASGLDPDISPAGAYYQVPRVARTRGISEKEIRALVTRNVEGRQFGGFGEPRVNVLELNLALDRLAKSGR